VLYFYSLLSITYFTYTPCNLAMSVNTLRTKEACFKPLLPTLSPKVLAVWEENYKIQARKEFGDAAVFVFGGPKPEYMLKSFSQICADEGTPNPDNLTGFRKTMSDSRATIYVQKREKFTTNLTNMFDDLLMHMSEDSKLLLTSDTVAYAAVETNRDTVKLWTLIRISHTVKNRKVSDRELTAARQQVEALTQIQPNGTPMALTAYNKVWNTLTGEATKLGVVWTSQQLVLLYLNSVDNSEFRVQLAELLRESKRGELPKTVIDAQFWVSDTLATVSSLTAQDELREGNKRKYAQIAHPVDLPSRQSGGEPPKHKDCAFCGFRHQGGADACLILKSFCKEKSKLVKDFVQAYKDAGKASARDRTNGSNASRGKATPRGGRARGRGRGGGKRANLTVGFDPNPPTDINWWEHPGLTAGVHIKDLVSYVSQLSPSQQAELRTQLALDNGANCCIFCNEDLCWDVHDCNPVMVHGIGDRSITRQGMSVFGPCLISSHLPFNLVAQCAVTDRHRLQFDNSVSPHFLLDNCVEWKLGHHQLFWLPFNDALLVYRNHCSTALMKLVPTFHHPSTQKRLTAHWNQLEEPETPHYSADQKRRAAAVQKIHAILNHINDVALGILFDSGAIHGCPYTSRDVRIMRKIYGPCPSCTKGKSVRPTPGEVINRLMVMAPGERLCMDVFFLTYLTRGGKSIICPFLIVVDDYSGRFHVVWMKSRTTESVRKALFTVIEYYNSYDWVVREVSADREAVLATLAPALAQYDPRIEFDRRGTDQKQETAERSIRTVRDTFRAWKASLWYRPPQYLYPYFLEDLADTCAHRPNSKTVNRTPEQIITGRKLYFTEHLRVSLGAVGEFYNPTDKTMHAASLDEREQRKNEERTATGIVIKRNFDATGTLQVYLLETGIIVNRARMKQELHHSNERRRYLESLDPNQPSSLDEMMKPVLRLTTYNKSVKEAGEDTTAAGLETMRRRRDNYQEHEEPSTSDDVPTGTPEDGIAVDNTQTPTGPVHRDSPTGAPPVDLYEDTDEPTGDHSEHSALSQSNPSNTFTEDSRLTEQTDNLSPTGVRENCPHPADTSADDITSASKDSPRPRNKRRRSRSARNTSPNPAATAPKKPRSTPSRGHQAQQPRPVRTRQPPKQFYYAIDSPQAIYLREKYGYLLTACSQTQVQQHCYMADDSLSIDQAVAKYPDQWSDSLTKELQQFHDMQVGKVVKDIVPNLRHKRLIRVKGFYKEVFNLETGDLLKLKFRLVPEGHRVDKSVYTPEEKTSPTVSLESVMAAINVAAFEGRKGFTMDIPGAYLNAKLKDPHMVKFPPSLATAYCKLYPEYRDSLQTDGSLLLLIEKAFYGFVESSALWYTEISKFLLSLGYQNHPADKGLFIKSQDRDKITVCLWVDDFLGFSNSPRLTSELHDAVVARFGDARFKDGDVLSYIGMTITQPALQHSSKVTQLEYTKRIVAASGVTKTAKNPYHPALNTTRSQSHKAVNTTEFLSLLMSAMYLGKRTRPDILTALSYLGTRVTSPDELDMKCLLRVYEYLNGTQTLGLTFTPQDMQLYYWCDAAYACHVNDLRGHTGMLVTLGQHNAPICAKSTKQKIHSRSSTEAELLALDITLIHLLWLIQILTFMGYPQQPTFVFQDNKSTMTVCESGHSKNGRLKHMAVRWHFIHGHIESGTIKLQYLATKEMVADILTKPLEGHTWTNLRNLLLNCDE
jgi:hypothetical protein